VAQPDFINAAAIVSTALDAESLLQALLSIERRWGRVRDNEVRWGPRVLDLDLLLYGREIIDRPGLQVPHPHLHQRAFALTPLAEIAPDMWIPGRGTVTESLRSLMLAVEAERIAVPETMTSIETKQES
jgi:2-amino-4-hydroxy-6-hydroxymethyldihydropteridine diphosphokinase